MTVEARCNVENMKKLINALQDKKYKQAFKQLKNGDNCFCIMGLACELSGLGRWEHNTFRLKEDNYEIIANTSPPSKVLEHYGFSGAIVNDLMFANDAGKSFKKLAECIKVYYDIKDK